LTPAIMAEMDERLAFSQDKALALEVEWTSMIAGPSLDIQVEYLNQVAESGEFPFAATLGEYITAEEATARYENLQAWHAARRHLWIGTGVFFVEQVFPVEGTITLARYADYIFPSDEFSGFGEPMIAVATVDGPTLVTAGEEAVFDVFITFGDDPYPAEDLDSVSYTIFDAAGEMVADGEAEMVAEGQYEIVLTAEESANLDAGASRLTVAVSSRAVSLPTFVTYEFVAAR
jgi:peptide/nickel transport system substrate-binding protein